MLRFAYVVICVLFGIAGIAVEHGVALDNATGGTKSIPVDSPELHQPLMEALPRLNDFLNKTFAYRIRAVNFASVQVVQGQLFDFSLLLGVTTCRNGMAVVYTRCPAINGGASVTCTFKLWSRPWLPPPDKWILYVQNCA